MKAINIFVMSLALALVATAYFQGGNRLEAGFAAAAKMFVSILPALLCAFLIAGFMRVLLPETVIQNWLGKEAGFKGIFVGYIAGALTFGGPFISFPLAASLYSGGASVATVTAYITSWALWGGGIVFYELAILGPRLFTIRIVSSLIFPLVAALTAGYLSKAT